MSRNTLNLWVGTFVALGMLAVLFLALRVGNLSASLSAGDTYELHAAFQNIGGLKIRGAVKSAGVVVGRVADIRLNGETYDADVTIKVDSQFKFPKDTNASVLTSGLLGEQYVGLTPGGDPVALKGGDTLKMTQSALVLEQLIGRFFFDKAAEGGGKDKEPK